MGYSSKKRAIARAESLAPEGWKFEVWGNFGGWYVKWYLGPVSVHEDTRHMFHAFVSDEPASTRGIPSSGGDWWSATEPKSSGSILEAAEAGVRKFRSHVANMTEAWSEIEAEIKGVCE